MGNELQDGTTGGYEGYCDRCGQSIKTNIQGNEIGEHECIPIKIPAQIGCIIPIWGNAVNNNLKSFIIWFNENYEVKKKEQ